METQLNQRSGEPHASVSQNPSSLEQGALDADSVADLSAESTAEAKVEALRALDSKYSVKSPVVSYTFNYKPDAPEVSPDSLKSYKNETLSILRPRYNRRQEASPNEKEAKESPLVSSLLSPVNRARFETMSNTAKNLFGQTQEILLGVPAVSRFVAKMGTGWKQFWINRHEEKRVFFKNEMDTFDMQVGFLEESKREIQLEIQTLQQEGGPVASLQLVISRLEAQQRDVLNKKNLTQTKFEEKENKVKINTNERDAIAQKAINRYEEKLRPMEQELERLNTSKDRLDLELAVQEIKFRELAEKIKETEQRKARIENSLRRSGMTEADIRKNTKELEKCIVDTIRQITSGKDFFAKKYNEINREIAKADAKANPYRDKRDEFARIKEGRPLDISVPERKRVEVSDEKEEVGTHRREELYGSSNVEPSVENQEVSYEKRLTAEAYIGTWNTFLQGKYATDSSNKKINVPEFNNLTKLSVSKQVEAEEFKKVLSLYYKANKMLSRELQNDIDGFFTKK